MFDEKNVSWSLKDGFCAMRNIEDEQKSSIMKETKKQKSKQWPRCGKYECISNCTACANTYQWNRSVWYTKHTHTHTTPKSIGYELSSVSVLLIRTIFTIVTFNKINPITAIKLRSGLQSQATPSHAMPHTDPIRKRLFNFML